jgi:hypothetical protein
MKEPEDWDTTDYLMREQRRRKQMPWYEVLAWCFVGAFLVINLIGAFAFVALGVSW